MSNGPSTGIAARRVLIVGNGDRAAALGSSLEGDGIDVVPAPSAPVALATLDAVDVDCLVLVDDAGGRPDDFFGAVQRKGHQVPGVFVGEKARRLPPAVEQAPAAVDAAASTVRQRLLTAAAADAEPVGTDDALAAYGSTVAHELRNHLGAAGMAVESLDGPTKEQATTALERLRDLATEAEAVASGDIKETQVVGIDEVAADASARIHGQSFTVDVEAARRVEANRQLLTLLFENLFRNSLEHGGLESTVRVVDTDTGVSVVDDGPGFATDRPFEWGNSTGSGQGAGLAVVRRIAQAHGWQVTASNDGGARVDLILD